MSTPLEVLKFNLQERQYPYFNEDELQMLLDTYDNDVKKATYQGLLMKSNTEQSITVGPIKIDMPGQEYWLTLAEKLNTIKGDDKPPTTGYYKTSKIRSDGQ